MWMNLEDNTLNEKASHRETNQASLVAQMVKNLPARQETQVRPLGDEDPLEKEMETHSSILAWRIPRTEESSRLQSKGLQRIRHNGATNRIVKFIETRSKKVVTRVMER